MTISLKNYSYGSILFVLALCLFAPLGTVEAKSGSNTINTSASLEAAWYNYNGLCSHNCTSWNPDDWEPLNPKWVPVGTLNNPSVTVNHAVSVFNNTTGSTVSDLGTVAVSDSITFIPQADASSDISWFGTGYSDDSPNGRWGGAGTLGCTGPGTGDYIGQDTLGPLRWDLYIGLHIQPTAPTLVTSANLSCTGFTCTVNAAGPITATVTYPATTGEFYFTYDKTGALPNAGEDWTDTGCNDAPLPMANNALLWANGVYPWSSTNTNTYAGLVAPANKYVLSVPSIPIGFTLTSIAGNTAPNAPTIGGTATYINTAYPFTFTATDANADSIRYGIDWDMDSIVDEYVPAAGYVSSGTLQGTNHTWLSIGVKNFQARTEDSQGGVSTWTPYSVTVDSQPDLSTSGFSPTTAEVETPVTFTATVANAGSSATPSFNSVFYICPTGDSTCEASAVVKAKSVWGRIIAYFRPSAEAAVVLKLPTNSTTIAATGSGTQTATHTFTTPGSYSVRFCANNDGAGGRYFTEPFYSDNCGSWTTVVASNPTGAVSCTVVKAGLYGNATYTATPSGGATSPYVWDDSIGGIYGTGASIVRTYSSTPGDGTYGMSVKGTNALTAYCPLVTWGFSMCPTESTGSITAVPDRVLKGGIVQLNWAIDRAPASSCFITGPGVNVAIPSYPTCLGPTVVYEDLLSATPAITAQSTYTVTCDGLVKASVIVNLIPDFKEF